MGSGILLPSDFQKMRGTRHAGVVGSDQLFDFVRENFFGLVNIIRDILTNCVFDPDLILASRDNDFSLFYFAVTRYLHFMK